MVRVLMAVAVLLGVAGNGWAQGGAPRIVQTIYETTSATSGQQPFALAIIVNKQNPIGDVTMTELRAIFLAERGYWPDGKHITLVVRDIGQPERAAILNQICQMGESDLNRHFLQLTFTGTIQSTPKLLSTAVGMRKFVFNVPSAIGYVKLTDVDDSVKVLRVNGRLPTEPGYPLFLSPQGNE